MAPSRHDAVLDVRDCGGPRVRREKHGIRQVTVSWADPGARFTSLFEVLVIDWLREANVLAIARRLRLSWDQVARIQKRAVTRGLARRESRPPTRIGVDETSFQKRIEYESLYPRAMRG